MILRWWEAREKKCMENGESDTYVFLEIPRLVVERAYGARREPPTDAVEMEGMIAHAPRDRAIGRDGRVRVGLALDACNARKNRNESRCNTEIYRQARQITRK
jgi:hypothetical protein